LHSLFSADLNLTDTESSLEANPNRLDKELAEERGRASERFRVGNSPDIPIVLNDDASAIDMSGSCFSRDPEQEQEQEAHRGFDERIPLSLSRPERRDVTNINNQ